MKKSFVASVLSVLALATVSTAQAATPRRLAVRLGGGPSEQALSMALPTELLRSLDRLELQLSPQSEIVVEGTDASTEGHLSLNLRAQREGRAELVQAWSNQFQSNQTLQDRALILNFPRSECSATSEGKTVGVCLEKATLRLPKRILLDLVLRGWKTARLRNVRAHTLELTAPETGFLRMNGTLANIILKGGGAELDGVISGVLAADPSNPDAGDLSAQFQEFRTLVLAGIQGSIQVSAERFSPESFLRVDDDVITQLPYERP